MTLSQSTPPLMYLSLETFMIRTGLPILVELVDLLNSVVIFLCQMTLLRWLTFLLGSQTMILTVLLFWIYIFLLTLVFVLLRLSFHCEMLSCCCISFHWLSVIFTTGCPLSLHCLWLFSYWLGQSLWSFLITPLGGYLYTLFLLLLVNFVSGFKLELMYISIVESIRSSLTHLHGF